VSGRGCPVRSTPPSGLTAACRFRYGPGEAAGQPGTYLAPARIGALRRRREQRNPPLRVVPVRARTFLYDVSAPVGRPRTGPPTVRDIRDRIACLRHQCPNTRFPGRRPGCSTFPVATPRRVVTAAGRQLIGFTMSAPPRARVSLPPRWSFEVQRRPDQLSAGQATCVVALLNPGDLADVARSGADPLPGSGDPERARPLRRFVVTINRILVPASPVDSRVNVVVISRTVRGFVARAATHRSAGALVA